MAFSIRHSLAAALLLLTPLAAASCAQAPSPAQELGATFRTIDAGGVNLRIAEMGSGPLVILVHGFPESWYSWRHQIPVLAAAGYHVVAPDMRGYGKSDKPAAITDYDMKHLTDDIVGIVDAMGEKKAILIGHDWGAAVTWNAMLLRPDRFSAIANLSVPYRGRNPDVRPMDATRKLYGENFWYTIYFQDPGVAEKEFDANPREFLSRMYVLYGAKDLPVEKPEVTDPRASAGGWIPRMGKPKSLPAWLSEKDLDYYVSEFTEAGFRGGINYYRNSNRNWEITPQLTGAKINAPALFIAGQDDLVIRGASAAELREGMSKIIPDLRDVVVMPGAGHWIQQERPAEVNAHLLAFLAGLPK
jgi:pimeloyl-ACP methyl ester carboxylesterase